MSRKAAGIVSTKLLIVDDEPLTVDMLQTFLQINGYECIGAYNGEDGLILCQVEQPELLILDLMLPDIEGFEVCRRIRTAPEMKQFATMPVLVLSARAEDGARRRAMEAGANAYMNKPPRFAELLNELNRLMYERQVSLDAPQSQAAITLAAPVTPVAPTESVVAPSIIIVTAEPTDSVIAQSVTNTAPTEGPVSPTPPNDAAPMLTTLPISPTPVPPPPAPTPPMPPTPPINDKPDGLKH